MQPDVKIETLSVQEAGKWTRIFTIRVKNGGALDVSDVDVDFSLKYPNEAILEEQSFNIPGPLPAGAYYDLTHIWQASFGVGKTVIATATADPGDSILEFDEENNSRSTTLIFRRVADKWMDESPDLGDEPEFDNGEEEKDEKEIRQQDTEMEFDK